MSLAARIVVFLLVFVPVVALGYAFRHPITNWVSNLGSKSTQDVVLTQASASPTATAAPSASPTVLATVTAPTPVSATAKPSTTTSIAQITPTPKVVASRTLPVSGPGDILSFSILIAVAVGTIGMWQLRSKKAQ